MPKFFQLLCCFIVSWASSQLVLAEDAQPDSETAVLTSGKVVDVEGKPVAGVIVHVGFKRLPTRGLRHYAEATTSDDGTFKIKRPEVPAILWVFADDDKQGSLLQLDKKPGDVTLELVALASVHGKLTDESGAPLAGASIVCGTSFRVGPRSGYSIGFNTSRKTGEDGTYTVPGLFPGEECRVQATTDPSTPLSELKMIKPEKAKTIELGETPLTKGR